MAYLGRYTLGDLVPLYVEVQNTSGTLTNDSPAVPTIDVWSASAKVAAGLRIPVDDRYVVNGLYWYWLSLNDRFTTGTYTAVSMYRIATTSARISTDVFEVVAGGNVEGAAIGMHYFKVPQTNFVIMQTDGGRIIRLRNPRI